MAVATCNCTETQTSPGTIIGGLFGALILLGIIVNITIYIHQREWWKSKLTQVWGTVRFYVARGKDYVTQGCSFLREWSISCYRHRLTNHRHQMEETTVQDVHYYCNNDIIVANLASKPKEERAMDIPQPAKRSDRDAIYSVSVLDEVSERQQHFPDENVFHVYSIVPDQTRRIRVDTASLCEQPTDGSKRFPSYKEDTPLPKQLNRAQVESRISSPEQPRFTQSHRVASSLPDGDYNGLTIGYRSPGRAGIPLPGMGTRQMPVKKQCDRLLISFPGARSGLYAVGTVSPQN